MRLKTVILIPLVASISLPATASAWNYQSQSNPLKTSNGRGQGFGTGKVTDGSNGTVGQVTGTTRDRAPGNDPIYWEASTWGNSGLCFAPEYTSCSQAYYHKGSFKGTSFNSGEWRRSTNSKAVPPDVSYYRINFKVCEAIRYRPDSCSGESIPRSNVKLG